MNNNLLHTKLTSQINTVKGLRLTTVCDVYIIKPFMIVEPTTIPTFWIKQLEVFTIVQHLGNYVTAWSFKMLI